MSENMNFIPQEQVKAVENELAKATEEGVAKDTQDIPESEPSIAFQDEEAFQEYQEEEALEEEYEEDSSEANFLISKGKNFDESFPSDYTGDLDFGDDELNSLYEESVEFNLGGFFMTILKDGLKEISEIRKERKVKPLPLPIPPIPQSDDLDTLEDAFNGLLEIFQGRPELSFIKIQIKNLKARKDIQASIQRIESKREKSLDQDLFDCYFEEIKSHFN